MWLGSGLVNSQSCDKISKTLQGYGMDEILDSGTKEIIIDVLSCFEPQLVVLFGSYASKDADKQSDMDIGFLPLQKIDNLSRWDAQERLASRLLVDVDLIDMSCANEVLNFQIVSSGVVLYTKDRAYSEKYMDMVYAKYLQLNEDRKEILECY
jgi:predicted nucleotidyltransferase